MIRSYSAGSFDNSRRSDPSNAAHSSHDAHASDAAGTSNLSGDWQATVHFFGSTQYAILHLEQTGEKVTGTIFGTEIECQLKSTMCAGTVRDGINPPNGTIRLMLEGSEIQAEGSDGDGPFDFVARRPVVPTGAPRTRR